MGYLVSDPAWTQYDVTEGDLPAIPSVPPPHYASYLDYSTALQYEMQRSIGAHPWVQLVAYDSSGVEIDLTHCVADGGLGGFSFELPDRQLAEQGYQITDWRIGIRRTHVAELTALLSYDGTPWRGRRVDAYLRFSRAPDRIPLYSWRVDDIVQGDSPLLVLLDMRREMLRGPLYADGMDVPDATTWVTTLEQEDAGGGTPPPFHSEYVEVGYHCNIGRVEITLTGATSFTITAPNHEGEGSTTLDYYSDPTYQSQSAFIIRKEAWGSGPWEEGDIITWTWTYSFKRQRDLAGYIRLPAAMYYLARMGGYGSEDFDASPAFPNVPNVGTSSWWLTGYPCIATEGDWGADLVGPATNKAYTWDYAEWQALRSHYCRIAFSRPCTVLEAIAEVGKGVAYIVPGPDGKLRLEVPSDLSGEAVELKQSTGLMRCYARREPPGSWMRGVHEYNHITGEWQRVLYWPENEAEAYQGYDVPEGTQEAYFLGYPRVLESVVRSILESWHITHKDGAPLLILHCGLPGMCFALGHRLQVTSTVEDVYEHRAVVDRVSYDFTRWAVTCEAIDWSELQLEPLIFQPDSLADETQCFDSTKVFT